MAKLNCPKCPDFDGFAMCTSQPLSKVASYEWCRKYLEGLEEVNGTITLSTDLFLRLLRKAYSDAYYGAIHMEFMRDIKDVEYPLEIHIDDTPKLEKLGLLGPGIIILCWFISPIGAIIKLYNKNIEYTNQLDKQQYARKMFFDKLWKVYLQKYEICELNKNTFLEVTNMIMEGRHDGAQVTWKWLQENQNIPYSEFTKFYGDLSGFVNGQREEYYKLEEACMETVELYVGFFS